MDLGGIETFLMNVYRNIDRSQIQFDFLCHNRIEAAYTEEIRSLGGKLYCVRGMSHGGPYKYEKRLYDFFINHKEYRIVHAHMNDLNGVILKQAYKAGIMNRFSHSHTVYRHKNILYTLKFLLFRIYVNKYTTCAFSCSKLAGEQLYTGRLKETFSVIPNAIDVDRFRFNNEKRESTRNDLGIGNGPAIGHVGRFAPVKNHTFILECFSEFLKYYPNARLVLIGKGELENYIRNKAVNLSINDKVLFLGNRTDVNYLLDAFDILLFPSIKEGLPVSVVEAQASGLQVLASDSISSDAEITDLYHNLSLAESAETWATKMNELYKNSKNYERISYANKVSEEGFDIRRTAVALSEIYLRQFEREER